MNAEGLKLVALVTVTALVVGGLALLGPRLLGAAAGPEVELVTAIKQAEKTGVELEVAGSTELLRSSSLSYQRLSVKVDPSAGVATVTATLDFQGTFGHTTVSSLGVEQVTFAQRGSAWVPTDSLAPRLTHLVAALEHRRRQLEGTGELPDAGDLTEQARILAIDQRSYRAVAWYARCERDEATVTEEYQLQGRLPGRPVDERGSKRLNLKRATGGEFFFPNGLM